MGLSNGHPFFEFQAYDPWLDSDSVERSESSVYFRQATSYREYGSDPYNILDFLGDLGGLLDIILVFGLLLTFSHVKNAFVRSLLRDAYQVQSYTKNTSEFYASKRIQETMNNKLGAEIKLTSTEDSQNDDGSQQTPGLA